MKNHFLTYYHAFVDRCINEWILCKIGKEKDKDEIVVMFTPGIGDDIYGLAYLRSLKQWKKKRIVAYALCTKKELFDNFSDVIDRVVYFNKEDYAWKRFQIIYRSLRLRKKCSGKGISPVLIAPYHHNPKNDDGRDWLKVLREDVFKFPADYCVKIHYPDFSHTEISAIPDFEINKSRIIVINPYSNCMDNPMLDLYDSISLYLVDKGYIVYTNVVGEQKTTAGSIPLNCSIYEFYAICNQIPMVISTRSGILDLVVSAKTNFLVYYLPFGPVGKYLDRDVFFHRYTLQAWETGNVTEHFFHDMNSALEAFESFYNRVTK